MYVDMQQSGMEVKATGKINHNRQKSIPTTIGAQGTLTNQQIVNKYFQSISKRDIHDLLDLFDEDAVVYEPFSNIKQGLQGKSAIENFLRVAIMANAGLKRTIKFVDKTQDKITAIVTFERGDSVTGKFSFTFITSKDEKSLTSSKRIKVLKIEFIEN
jgi:ketosteroid isomerase-like protein